MAVQHRKQLSRLDIPSPLNSTHFNGQPLFSAAPNHIQQSLHQTPHRPTYHVQTPSQANFTPLSGPQRPRHGQAASVAQFPGGFFNAPSSAGPATPGLKPPFVPMHQRLGSSAAGTSPMKSRRTASISIGGPPKALLGGPQRKVSPLPGTSFTEPAVAPPSGDAKALAKKVNVRLPDESGPVTYEGVDYPSPPWARQPHILEDDVHFENPIWTDTISREAHPSHEFCHMAQHIYDVSLPTQNAWDSYRMSVIDERLARLGIESSSSVFSDYEDDAMHVALPKSPADSISSPADPALLAFKLNKLQRASSASPSPSWFQKGWTNYKDDQALPAPPTQHGNMQSSPLLAPQAWAPNARSTFLANGPDSASSSRPLSRRDFARGFGFDIPEEQEEDEVKPSFGVAQGSVFEATATNFSHGEPDDVDDNSRTAAPTRIHSRHVSKSQQESHVDPSEHHQRAESIPLVMPREHLSSLTETETNPDAASEWTGSEDGKEASEVTDEDDDKSLGEFSNPSDEERAHQHRMHLRMKRLSRGTQEIPRRLPNFPIPPDTPASIDGTSLRRLSADQLSNPSDEDDEKSSPLQHHTHNGQSQKPHSAGSHGQRFTIHSRVTSSQTSNYENAPDEMKTEEGRELSSTSQRRDWHDSLNPHAKPFVFEGNFDNSKWSIARDTEQSHQRQHSMGRSLNASAQEFKPSTFRFRPNDGVPPPNTMQFHHLPSLDASQMDAGFHPRLPPQASVTDYVERESRSFNLVMKTPELPTPREVVRAEPIAWNLTAQPFMPSATTMTHLPQVTEIIQSSQEADSQGEGVASIASGTNALSGRSKNVPPPLDIPHKTYINTMPLSAFNSLTHGDSVELISRASAPETRESQQQQRSRRQSLDDLHVAPISRKASQLHAMDTSFNPQTPRNTELRRGSPVSTDQSLSSPSPRSSRSSLSSRAPPFESNGGMTTLLPLKQHIEDLLDDKLEMLRRDLIDVFSTGTSNHNASALQHAISQLEPLLRAPGAFEPASSLHELITNSNDRLQNLIHARLDAARQEHREQLDGILPVLQEMSIRQVSSTATALSDIIPRLDALRLSIQDSRREEPELVVENLESSILMWLEEHRATNLDIEYLTTQLSSAVRPQIHQLIDLTSDKKETAALIAQQLSPLLKTLVESASKPPDLSIVAREISAFLTPQITAWNDPGVFSGLATSVASHLEPLLSTKSGGTTFDTLPTLMEKCLQVRISPLEQTMGDLREASSLLRSEVSEISTAIDRRGEFEETSSKQIASLISKVESIAAHQEADTLADALNAQTNRLDALGPLTAEVKGAVEIQQTLDLSLKGLIELHKQTQERIVDLSSTVLSSTGGLSQFHKSVLTSVDQLASKASSSVASSQEALCQHLQSQLHDLQVRCQELERSGEERNVRAINSESRNAMLEQKIAESNIELAAQNSELKANLTRIRDLDSALSKALEHVKIVESSSSSYEAKIAKLEEQNRELGLELDQSQSIAETLKMEAKWNVSDKATLERELNHVSAERDRLLSQEVENVDLRKTKIDIDSVLQILRAKQDEDHENLQAIRDSNKILEGEHLALQRRFKEQEGKLTNVERASMTARQNLAQAQQRASDWEKKAKDFETQLEGGNLKIIRLNDAKTQLEVDCGSLKSKLEERDASNKAYIDTLQEELTAVKRDSLQTKKDLYEAQKGSVHTWRNHVPNGLPASSSSSAGTIHEQSKITKDTAQAYTPFSHSTAHGRMVSPENTSTWDSMHAPKAKGRSAQILRQSASSPTPSTVSNAPTLQDDGWWS